MRTDCLVIGGGSAGCVLAARLSERRSTHVVLIEMGDDINSSDIRDLFPRAYANPSYFGTVNCRFLDNASLSYWDQPRVLGGGSSVMGMWSVRGLRADYEAWAAFGGSKWNYESVLPFFKRLETDLDFQNDAHGSAGPVSIQRVKPESWPLVMQAISRELHDHGLPSSDDLNGAKADEEEGLYPLPLSIHNGQRASAVSAYLTDEIRRRPNLTLLLRHEARRLLVNSQEAQGAQVVGPDGRQFSIYARRTILSAGAIHSPTLLLRSGIGPAKQLAARGVTIVANLPVGANLANHALMNLGSFIRREARQSRKLRLATLAIARLSSKHPRGSKSDLLLSFSARTSAHGIGNCLLVAGAALYAPLSRGDVSLSEKDNYSPEVNFRALSEPADIARLTIAANFTKTLLSSVARTGLIGELFLMPSRLPIREFAAKDLRAWIRNAGVAGVAAMPQNMRRRLLPFAVEGVTFLDADNMIGEEDVLRAAVPMFHPSGTCAIGKVVDPLLRVMGLSNLYVADASVMPVPPRANTNIPTLMIAEKAASMLGASG